MKSRDFIEFNCLEVRQPIGTFYIGAINAEDLVGISFADVRRIEERDIERLVGTQRPLVKSRVKEIREYVKTIDATFPTSVILAIDSENAKYYKNRGMMQIKRRGDVAKIIDGQHRIDGLKGFNEDFQVNVTIFVDMDLEDQAMVFATINLKQTRVNKSLAYDLYEFASSRSPQKTSHNIVKLLNMKQGSPFKKKIKILGKATGSPFETLTQATFVECLLPYISDNPLRDRDDLKRHKKLKIIEPPLTEKLIFGNMFIEKRDAEIAKILFNYFDVVKQKWSSSWSAEEQSIILSRSTGFVALMRFLRDVYVSFQKPGEIISKREFKTIFEAISLEDENFTTDKYKPGGGGQTALYKDFLTEFRRTHQ